MGITNSRQYFNFSWIALSAQSSQSPRPYRVRKRSTHFEDNQTLSLRDVDPAAYEGVSAIIDDGCSGCSRSEAWRQCAGAKVKVLGLHPISLHRTATTFNGVGTSTTNQKPTIPMGVTLCAVSLFWSDDLLSLTQSKQTCFPRNFPFSAEGLGLAMDVSDTSSTLTSSDPDEYDGHNIWNPMLELLCHAHIGVFMEALFDEEDVGRIAFSCHFALDIPCDKE